MINDLQFAALLRNCSGYGWHWVLLHTCGWVDE